MPFDLVIRSGTVVDGTGAAPRTADVAVTDGRIVEIGRVGGKGVREIDADGAIVAPGFVDIHTHYDGQATWDERLQPSSLHGVTTVVSGNCGVGFAPVHVSDHERLVELMEGVEDIPGAVLDEGLPWEWESIPDYLDALDRRHYDIDVAAQVSHAPVRLYVMGRRGAERETGFGGGDRGDGAPRGRGDPRRCARLQHLAHLNHRTSRGEPTPTLTAAADELVGIARAIGETGGACCRSSPISPTAKPSDETLLEMMRGVRSTALDLAAPGIRGSGVWRRASTFSTSRAPKG